MTNCWRSSGIDPDSNEPRMPPTMQGEENQSPHNDHQRANTMHISSQSKANGVNHILSNKANTKHSNEKDHNGQHKSVNRPAQIKQTEEPQEHKCHEEILSVHIDGTKNQRTTPRLVAQKQQHYLTQVPHSAAYQNVFMITSAISSHQWSSTQT